MLVIIFSPIMLLKWICLLDQWPQPLILRPVQPALFSVDWVNCLDVVRSLRPVEGELQGQYAGETHFWKIHLLGGFLCSNRLCDAMSNRDRLQLASPLRLAEVFFSSRFFLLFRWCFRSSRQWPESCQQFARNATPGLVFRQRGLVPTKEC